MKESKTSMKNALQEHFKEPLVAKPSLAQLASEEMTHN